MNVRVLFPLARATARAIKWAPIGVATGLGLLIAVLPTALITKLTGAQLIELLRISATCGALGAAFLLDDPAARSTPTVPTPRLSRNIVRAAVTVPAAVLWWTATLTIAGAVASASAAAVLPTGALVLETAALVSVGLAMAAIAQRYATDGDIGVIAAPAMLILATITWFLPHRIALLVAPTDPQWAAAHHRWVGVLGIAVAVFLWASRERTPRRERPAASRVGDG